MAYMMRSQASDLAFGGFAFDKSDLGFAAWTSEGPASSSCSRLNGSGDFSSRKAIAGQIQRIALILRNYLPDRAKDVRAIVIIFGSGNFGTREEVKLP